MQYLKKGESMDVDTTETFKQHYDNLKKIRDELRSQTEPNIDDLIPMVESGIQSYNICKSRIESVKAAFNQLMPVADRVKSDISDISG